jgi:hypothetical protein
LKGKKPRKKKIVKLSKPLLKRKRRYTYSKYTADTRKWVIRLYFGGDDKFDKPQETYKYVSKVFAIPLMTVRYIIKEFISSGCNLDAVGNKRGKFGMLPLDV